MGQHSVSHQNSIMKVVLALALVCVGLAAAAPQKDVQFPGQCKVCTDAVDALETLLDAFGPDEPEVKAFVEGLCAELPILQDQCKSLVDEIIGYVDQNKAPEEICTLITVCPDPSL